MNSSEIAIKFIVQHTRNNQITGKGQTILKHVINYLALSS